MRRLIITLAFLATGSAALADTLQEVTTHGVTITAPGVAAFDVEFTLDGKCTSVHGQFRGAWRIDGDKLCTRWNGDTGETCIAYPKGKTSGDSFDVRGPRDAATVTIK